MLEIRNLHSYYGEAYVLHGIDLIIPESKVVALLGRNGMGKTTTIRSITGLRPPTVRQGTITYRGKQVGGMEPHQIAMLGVGLVPQGRRLFPSLTVTEHLDICPHRPISQGRTSWTRQRIFELFPRLAERRSHRGQQLSGGERQMLAIGRALMLNPDLILMDEPTEGLAPVMVRHVEETVETLQIGRAHV
jgi:branched-chain amino acid transport system ATP-binding protein